MIVPPENLKGYVVVANDDSAVTLTPAGDMVAIVNNGDFIGLVIGSVTHRGNKYLKLQNRTGSTSPVQSVLNVSIPFDIDTYYLLYDDSAVNVKVGDKILSLHQFADEVKHVSQTSIIPDFIQDWWGVLDNGVKWIIGIGVIVVGYNLLTRANNYTRKNSKR